MVTMADFDYIFFKWLMKEHDIEIRKLLIELENLKHELACIRNTRALMRFTREQEYRY